jgi:hypothetical protein
MSGVIPLIKTAIKNLDLKLSMASSSSTTATKRLTAENNKNEIKFSGKTTMVVILNNASFSHLVHLPLSFLSFKVATRPLILIQQIQWVECLLIVGKTL